jgi:hypothetical protein
MIQVCLASEVSPKTALDISSSLVKEQWGHFHSKTVIGVESSAVLPVVEALHFDPIVNVCVEDLVFVAMVGGDGGGKRTL